MKIKRDYYHSWEWSNILLVGVGVVLLIMSAMGEGCSDQERSALLQLKPFFSPDRVASWDNKTMNTNSDCCGGWAGVTCSSHGRVISLQFSYFSYDYINGNDVYYNYNWHFNASILRPFQHLQQLDLSSNSIATWSSADLLLPNLEVLDLSDNCLDNMLSNLSGFPSLRQLILSFNKLIGPIRLPDIKAIKNLEELDLCFNNISGLMDNDGLGHHHRQTALQKLDLSGNQLEGDIPACLQSFVGLRKIYLSNNKLTGEIPSWFGNWIWLHELDLSYNLCTGNIPILHLPSLEYLDLSYNHLQIPLSFKPFANLTSLKTFYGDSNQVILDNQTFFIPRFQLRELRLFGCGLTRFPPFLHHQHELTAIDMMDNMMEVNFPTWLLENNPRLTSIGLQNNSLTGELHLPSSTNIHLSSVDLKYNKLQGHFPKNISTTFPNLDFLDMSYNELQGNIPSTICDIKPLLVLYLQNNHLSGGLQPLTHGCLHLWILDLSNNHFEGDLPSFQGLPSLSYLLLHGNNLSGSVIAKNFKPTLKFLDLSYNSLEGSVPKFSKDSALGFLDLSHNKLNGSLPSYSSSIGSQIDTLLLSDNRLNGNIKAAFCNNSMLLAFDISNNYLSGPIPACIANFNRLYFLLMRGNQFHGHIPTQLCNLSQLTILDLSNNILSGSLPSCLRKPNFEANNFMYGSDFADVNINLHFTTKGRTYNYSSKLFKPWFMSAIDLSCNRLTGEIPHELGNMSKLNAFNLSHNKLSGGIPGTLSTMKHLESLDFSYNNLSGPIPAQISELDFLQVFNVAYNNLSGMIPFQGHSTTFDASSYKGNPLLCGPPLSIKCNSHKLLIIDEEVEEGGWIDMGSFYISCIGSGIVMFFTVIIIVWLNPRFWC